LLFPPAERLWALKPDFHCGLRKKREFALFSFALGAFTFFRALFSSRFRALFSLHAHERESAKKAPAPTSAVFTVKPSGREGGWQCVSAAKLLMKKHQNGCQNVIFFDAMSEVQKDLETFLQQ
jgi:hypothetical protein